jgi:hypothetical protein
MSRKVKVDFVSTRAMHYKGRIALQLSRRYSWLQLDLRRGIHICFRHSAKQLYNPRNAKFSIRKDLFWSTNLGPIAVPYKDGEYLIVFLGLMLLIFKIDGDKSLYHSVSQVEILSANLRSRQLSFNCVQGGERNSVEDELKATVSKVFVHPLTKVQYGPIRLQDSACS